MLEFFLGRSCPEEVQGVSQATALLADAESSITSGAWDQAMEQLESIKQSQPSEPDVYRRLAHVQAVRGKFRSVISTYVHLVGILVEAEEFADAEEIIETVLALNPECEEAREKRILIEKKRGNVERAVDLSRELARLCIEQGDGDRSIRLLQDAQADQPGNLDISLELAEMYVSHGQIQDGANQYRKVANAFQETGNIAKAAEAYRRMKVVQSDDPEVLLTLGRLYTELGKLDEAEQEFRSVLRHDLEHQEALLELGLVCQLKGRFRSGLLAFNKVLQNNPKLPRAMRKLGELNLSMGKQAESVVHFLEAAQAYLEVEERDQAIEVFQIVLGVDEGNAQAQQGLSNLGAPLEPKEFVPPLPPTPPDEEPPTPEAAPVSASPEEPSSESQRGVKEEPEGSSSSAKKSSAGKSGSSSKGRRRGLVSSGTGLRRGLVDPSAGGGKPMLGKPTLGGGGGSTRAGLRRPGLGMKGGGDGDKPMMGMKPTLDRRPADYSTPETHLDREESIFDSSEDDFADVTESLFEPEERDEESEFGTELDVAAGDLFDDSDESPFGESDLGDSLFDSASSGGSAAKTPVIGNFTATEVGDSGGFSPSGLQPGFAPGSPVQDKGESADDIFDMAGAEDLFGDDEPGSGLFDDDALPAARLFEDDAGDGGDLFAVKGSGDEPEAADDIFSGEQFDSLFDSPDGGDELSASDTIGSLGGGLGESDLFAPETRVSEQAPPESAFDSLFSDVGEENVSKTDVDLFSDEDDQDELSGSSLFSESQERSSDTDLFGDDLFGPDENVSTAERSENLSGGDDLFSGEGLFEEPQTESSEKGPGSPLPQEDTAFDLGGLFEEEPAQSGELFQEDDLFGESVSVPQFEVQPSDAGQGRGATPDGGFDLFATAGEEMSQETESTPAPSEGLFDGFGTGEKESSDFDIFASEGDDGSDLFSDRPDDSDLFATESVQDDSLFAEASPGEDDGFAVSRHFDSEEDDLFSAVPTTTEIGKSQETEDLFDIGDQTNDGLFEEPSSDDSFFASEEDGLDFESVAGSDGGLFDSIPDAELETAAPLGLDLPMPGDAPLQVETETVSSEEEVGETDDLFGSSESSFVQEEETDEDAFTIDRLRAEEMAKVIDVPAEESADSPEFMRLLELTLPKAEQDEEPVLQDFEGLEETAPDYSSMDSGDLFGETSGEPGDDSLFESSQDDLFDAPAEPEPVDEGPAILGKPKVSLSIEDESPATDTEAADRLDQSLVGSDVAAKIAGYRKALEDAPNNLVMRTRLADIHLKYGMLQDALLQYRQVTKRNTDSISLLHRLIQAEFWTENYPEAGESLLLLAKLHLKRGEQHDALDTLQSVLSLDAHHFEARKVLVSVFTSLDESKLAAHHLRQLAETALTKGEVEEAVSAFQQLLDISNDPVFEERLAQIYESQGDMERALTSFQRLVGRYQDEERWEEAARVTERIVELNPELLADRGALVELYKKLGMEEKAMEQQFKLARLYQEKGQLDESIQLYEGVLLYNAENQDARRLLVDAYLDSGKVASALEQSEALTEHYLTTKDHQTAIELYTRLVEADPENVELQERLVKFYGLAGDPENAKKRWIKLADLHESRERFVKAAESIQKALELDETQIDLQNRLALLYTDKIQDKVAALAQLRKLFQLAPERLDAVKMYIDILLKEEQVAEAGQVLQQLEQAGGESAEVKNEVIGALKAQVEANPGDLKARFNYGELCYHLGDLDHAIEQFQQTRRNPEYELLSYNMLGLCFAKKKGFNMLDLAIKQFKKGLETRGRSEQSHLELRYNLATIQYQNGRVVEALADFHECYKVDITYRDVKSWIEKIDAELASSGS